jgi:hypothetical protein
MKYIHESSLLDRVKDFDIPPESLDLLTAPEEQLRQYGVPPRPDPELQQERYRVWLSFFVPRPTFVSADITIIPDRFRSVTAASVPISFRTTRYEASRNWCGAYIEPNYDRVFVEVSGRWIVPTPLPPPDAQPPNAQPKVYACSTWIGLDGQRRYIDSSLPQAGTWQAVTLEADGSQIVETYAWFQWWARNYAGTAPGQISSVPVHPGDEVACMVKEWQPSVAAIYVKNLTTNRLAHFLVDAPTVTLGGGQPHQFTISGATAEWIMERPTRLDSGEPYDLADYGSADLLKLHAVEADPTVPNWPWVVGTNQTLKGARLIRMYDLLKDPRRTAFISMPWRESDTSIRVSYGGFET